MSVRRTARYHELGGEGRELDELWYVLHGYGQLAAQFLGDFESIAGPRCRVVAPEGLSRFYRAGTIGEIGSSWMTKEAREDEIVDYVEYLDALHEHVLSELEGVPRITLLGFSQGTATGGRWVALGKLQPDHMILWGGALPPGIDLEARRSKFAAARLRYVVGERDPWIRPAEIEAERTRVQAVGLDFRLDTFAAAHRLDRETLMRLAAEGRSESDGSL